MQSINKETVASVTNNETCAVQNAELNRKRRQTTEYFSVEL